MRQALTIALLQLRLMLKSKSALLVMFVLPLFFITIFGTMGGGGTGAGRVYPIAVVDEDQSIASRKLTAALQAEQILAVRVASAAELPKLIADKQIVSAVRIPQGFETAIAGGAAAEVELVAPPGSNTQVAIRPAVAREASAVAADYRLALRLTGPNPAGIEESFDRIAEQRRSLGAAVTSVPARAVETKKGVSQLQGTSHGFSVMFVMMAVFSMTGVILQERQDGTWGRLLTTPAGRWTILSGYLLAFVLTGAVQFAGLVTFTSVIFGLSWGPLLPLAVVAGSFVICSAGLGLFVAGLVKTADQQRTAGTIVVVATSMLGGVYWPLELVGDTMRRIGYLTPQAWAMDGFREVMLRGGAWESVLWPVTVLLAFAVIFLAVGITRVRYH